MDELSISAVELAAEHDASAAARAEDAPDTVVIRDFGPVAGIIKTPGIDDALDAIESEEDVIKENVNLLEGAPQTRAELERWQELYRETLQQCNRRLMPRGVLLVACAPNPNGLGAVFVGTDHDKRDYIVTLTLPARERNDFARASKEDFVRWAIDVVCSETISQRDTYMRRAGFQLYSVG
jgi:hypothetical protein